jgi:hypothetical protein
VKRRTTTYKWKIGIVEADVLAVPSPTTPATITSILRGKIPVLRKPLQIFSTVNAFCHGSTVKATISFFVGKRPLLFKGNVYWGQYTLTLYARRGSLNEQWDYRSVDL